MGAQLLSFLNRLKSLVHTNRISLASRSVNRQSLLRYELAESDIHAVLLSLTPENYFRGPTPDHAGYPGDVMEFKAPVCGVIFYIKVRIWSENEQDQGVTISFHEDFI